MTTEISNKLKVLIRENLELKKNVQITLKTNIKDLGADSLETYELLCAIEDEFDICIPEETAEKFTTVKDYSDYIKNQITEYK